MTIIGGFACQISVNTLPTAGELRDDETRPMVWGLVMVFDTEDNYLGAVLTGGSDNPGVFSIEVDNPYPRGFYIQILPYSGVVVVVRQDDTAYIVETRNWYPDEVEEESYDMSGGECPT